MTSHAIQLQRRALALQRASELAKTLDPANEPLQLVINEPHPEDVYVLAEVAQALGKVVLEQRQHIAELGRRVEALEARGTK